MLALQYTFGNRYIVDEVALLFFLTLFLSCSDGDRMRGLMEHADSLNQCYASLADDSVMPSVVSWMDRHGTANERMRAHYLAGCVYRDRQQAPEALDWYHGAALCADTASNDCDFKCLSRIYSQISGLYADQNMMETALETSDKAIYYAWMCKDTAAVLALMDNNSVYDYYLGNEDKALATIFRVHDLYCLYGDTLTANTALGPAIGIYLAKGEYGKAESLLEKYEHQSLLTGQESFCEKQFYYLYCYKGLCFIETERYDSASYCFRKQINEGGTIDNVERGSQGLYKLYQKLGIIDSVSKYADICFSLKDSIAEASVYATLQQMQSLYDYSRHQDMARKESERAANMKNMLENVFFLFLLITVSFFFVIWGIRLRAAQRVRELSSEYAMDMITYQRLKSELIVQKQKEQADEFRIRELEEEINTIEKLIAQKQDDQKGPENWQVEDIVLDSPIVSIFHSKAAHGRSVSDREWEELRKLISHYMFDFLDALSRFDYQLNLKETNMCILIKLRFTPMELCNIFQMKPSAISNFRSRLYFHLFKEKGTATEFDDRIRSLSLILQSTDNQFVAEDVKNVK